MKSRATIFSLLFILSILSVSLANATFAASLEPLDGVLVVVNDDVITESDLSNRIKIVKQQLERAHAKMPSAANLHKQVLEQMIDQKLQLQAATKLNMVIDMSSLNDSIKNIAKNNNMNLTEFQERLQQDGINYQDFRNEVRDELLISRIHEREVKPRILVSDQEVDNFLSAFKQAQKQNREYRLQDIVISLPESPSPDEIEKTKQQAQAIFHQLSQGADFETMANAQSNGEQAIEGGDLGWRSLARLPTIFAEKVSQMKVGELAGPIRTDNGYHIIKLTDIRGDSHHHDTIETHVRHILVKTNPMMSDKEAKAKIEAFRQQIEKGARFETIAQRYSDDPGSAQQGGDLGWVEHEELVPEFAKAMDNLAPNTLSEPVKTPFGWHLIEVKARRTKTLSKEQERNQIRNMIGQRKLEEAVHTWIRQLRAQAYIKRY